MKFSLSRFWVVVGVSCLFQSFPARGFVVEHLYPEKFSKNTELLEFVLRNDHAWKFILNKEIKLADDSRPPYHGTAEDGISTEVEQTLRLIEATEITVTPLSIIQRVVGEFRWLGSYIDYAVFVLNKAFMCTTFEFLEFQIELIKLLESKSSSSLPGVVWEVNADRSLIKAWASAVQFIDKVAAMLGDLEILTDLTYEYNELMLENPGRTVLVLSLMAKEIGKFTESHCGRTDNKAILKHFGVMPTLEYLNGKAAKYSEVEKAFNQVVRGMIKMFGELDIKTMPMNNWIQILDFKIAVQEHINLYLKIDKILDQDEEGQKILKAKKAKTENKLKELSAKYLKENADVINESTIEIVVQ